MSKGDILIPKKIAQGLGTMDQDTLGCFFKQLLYSFDYSEDGAELSRENLSGFDIFRVVEPLLKSVNGFDDEGPEDMVGEERRQG